LFADPNTPISQVLDYIRVNLRENIKSKREKACMSTTSFIGFQERIGHESHRVCYQRKIKMCKTIA
jgi:hypothetical protein